MLIPMNKFSNSSTYFFHKLGKERLLFLFLSIGEVGASFSSKLTLFIRSDTSWGSYNTHVFKTRWWFISVIFLTYMSVILLCINILIQITSSTYKYQLTEPEIYNTAVASFQSTVPCVSYPRYSSCRGLEHKLCFTSNKVLCTGNPVAKRLTC